MLFFFLLFIKLPLARASVGEAVFLTFPVTLYLPAFSFLNVRMMEGLEMCSVWEVLDSAGVSLRMDLWFGQPLFEEDQIVIRRVGFWCARLGLFPQKRNFVPLCLLTYVYKKLPAYDLHFRRWSDN